MSRSFDFNPSAPLADDLLEHRGRILTNGDSGCHPGEIVHLPLNTSSTTTCSNRSSVSPPPQSSSPTRETDSPVEDGYMASLPAGTSICHQAPVASHAQRSYPFLFTPQQQPFFVAESDKLRKLRQKKERKGNRKEKNVLSTFKVEGNKLETDYNVDKILESLGEANVEKRVKNGGHIVGENKQSKSRKRSNGKDDEKTKLWIDESKPTSSDEELKATVARNEKSVENHENTKVEHSFSIPIGSLLRDIDLSGNCPTSNPEPGDLKRQTSKSTENLSFTKVTTKKKWKKKSPSTDDNNHIYHQRFSQNGFPSYETRCFTSGYNLRSRCGDVALQPAQGVVQSYESSRSSSTSLSEKSTFPLRGSPEQVRLTAASNALGPQQNTNLDLSADFPPLGPDNSDLPEASSASVASSSSATNSSAVSVWPVMKSSDPIAVIDNETNSEDSLVPTDEPTAFLNGSEGKHGGPPDITLPGISTNAAQSSLPDVAAQAPMDGADSSGCSGENTPPFTSSISTYDHQHQVSASSSTCPGKDDSSICGRDLSSRNSTASFFVDTENNVEIVLTDEEYNRRREFGAAPVIIFGKGDHPYEDWTNSPELEFGFELNENLLLTSFDAVPPTLLDNAIVSIGESLASFFPTSQSAANLQQQGSEYEVAVFDSRSLQTSNHQSGRSTPTAKEAISEGPEGEGNGEKEDFGYNHANYVQLITMVSKRWQLVEKELKSNAQCVVYYNQGRVPSAQV